MAKGGIKGPNPSSGKSGGGHGRPDKAPINGNGTSEEIHGNGKSGIINGGGGDDSIFGHAQAVEFIHAGGGDDIISANVGDVVFGNGGEDILVIEASIADFIDEEGNFLLEEGRGNTLILDTGEGIISFKHISQLQFSDYTYSLKGLNGPYAQDDEATVSEDGEIVDYDPLLNDFDFDGDSLTITTVTGGAEGVDVTFTDGTISYDPSDVFNSLAPGETATDTLSYTVCDSDGLTTTATLTITITGENDDPIVSAIDVGPVSEDAGEIQVDLDPMDPDRSDEPFVGMESLVLVGGSDGEGGTLADSFLAAVEFSLSEDGNSLVVDSTQFAEDLGLEDSITLSFEYSVYDLYGGSSVSTVTLTIEGLEEEPLPEGLGEGEVLFL